MEPKVRRQSAAPAKKFQIQARQAELSTYAKLFPWTCLAVFLGTAIPLWLVLQTNPVTYSERVIWINGITAVLAAAIGLFAVRFLPATPESDARPQIVLGQVLLVCLALGNAWLVLDTSEAGHTFAAVLIMLCVAWVFPRLSGLFVVSVPQLIVVGWMQSQAGSPSRWLMDFFITFGGTLVAWLGFYAKRTYYQRHHALLVERYSMIEALRRQSVERVRSQERVLSERNLTTLGRLAGGIAHDLNNILVPILGNAAMLEESVHTSTQKRQAREVMRAASRARSLTQQLGYFAARGNDELETLNLNQILSELCPIVWRTFPQGVDIKLQVHEHPIYLHANRMDLQDLITNLLLDAGNAAAEGSSVSVQALSSVHPPKQFQPPTDREYCGIVICDNAESLSLEKQARLCGPQPHPDLQHRGIGLLAARDRALALGGYLGADSVTDSCNHFCLFLPIHTSSTTGESLADPKISRAVATEILVVDDEPAVRRVTAQLLERAGFVVRQCSSGEEALLEINHHLPDMVVMDLRMPGMGGRAATESIRKQTARLPIVICTGYTGDAQGWLAELPNCTLLRKPYDTAELLSAVTSLLQAEHAAD